MVFIGGPRHFGKSLLLDTIPEDTTNRGSIDLTMILPESVWIFEFKVETQARASLQCERTSLIKFICVLNPAASFDELAVEAFQCEGVGNRFASVPAEGEFRFDNVH